MMLFSCSNVQLLESLEPRDINIVTIFRFKNPFL